MPLRFLSLPSINTVSKLLVDTGEACYDFHDLEVKDIEAEHVQADELWAFCYAKGKALKRSYDPPIDAGDVWTWIALDAGSNLIISWEVGDRDDLTAIRFIGDLEYRLANRVQITTDGLHAYKEAVETIFEGEIDFAQIKKTKRPGDPDEEYISTSLVESHNKTIRQQMKRFQRKTNAHSKKRLNHIYAVAVYVVWYNWCRRHSTHGMTPAVAAGLADEPYTIEWLAELNSDTILA